MNNSRKKKHLPPPPLSEVLGRLSDEPHDSELKVTQPEPPAPAPTEPPASEVLGRLSGEPYDSGLKVNQPPTPAEPPPMPEAVPADILKLPRGALVALRRSGGFKFRSREVVVFRDGRVNYDDGESGPHTVWTLSDAEMAELRRALVQVGFAKLPAAGRQNPDAFAYEIVARPARRVYSAEAFQGSIPASLVPLIKQLNGFVGMDAPS